MTPTGLAEAAAAGVAATAGQRPLDFVLPPELEAHEPPEARGVPRDGVRLLVSAVAGGSAVHRHARFTDLPDLLAPGDLVVVNTSATLPAALAVPGTGRMLHLSTELPGGLWLVELRRRAGHGTTELLDAAPGPVELAGGARAHLLAPWPGSRRLWLATIDAPQPVPAHLARHGEPVRYAYAGGAWPLAAYQTVYATEPGSAEMPSAGRPFTPEVLTRLMARGVRVAPLVLHAGLSSAEEHEPPAPERYAVPLPTARLVEQTRAEGGRVVAVGTTVVRALETTTDESGTTHPGSGWTDLVVTPERGIRAVDGLLTGWHPPRASHLLLLEALAGRAALEGAYAEAAAARYRWHEFGDVHLLLR